MVTHIKQAWREPFCTKEEAIEMNREFIKDFYKNNTKQSEGNQMSHFKTQQEGVPLKAYTQGISKTEFVAEMKKHQAMDAFIRGTYADDSKKHFQGCAVGCALESVSRLKKIKLQHRNHKEFENHLGVPEWLARLNDKVFENVPKDRTKTWPVEFSEAINEGAELNKVKIPFLIFICESARDKTTNKLAHNYIDGILFELRKDKIDKDALLKVRLAERPIYATAYAAYAAYAATDAAAYAAYAATDAATDADAYADAAADAAAYAATDAAARTNEFTKFADKLLELMKGCV